MKISLYDRVPYSISQREYTPEGFLKVPGHVARSGIQEYLASELGLDGNPLRIVKVYRPDEEVFSQESLATYNGVDVTDNHPDELVNSKTFKAVTVGNVTSFGVKDGDYVIAPLLIKDADAIKNIESGKTELSAGYTAEYVRSPGITGAGDEYEFIQRDIRINHVALVDNARAGAMARIFDTQLEVDMTKVTLDNGRAIELEDGVAAQVEDSISRLTAQAKKSEELAEGLQAKFDGLTEELKATKELASKDAIAEQVKAVSAAMDAARKLAGKEFVCDSVDETEIKRAALAVCKDGVAWADKKAAYVEAAFDMEMEKKEAEDEEEEEEKKDSSDSLARLAADLVSKDSDKPSAKNTFVDSLTNGWKKTIGEDA